MSINKRNTRPKITVITAVYNCHKFIERAILSVLNQSYDNIEFIIIDGGSSDGTVDIIKKYETNINFWLSAKDNGIYDAWNKGILNSSGKWISFLGADDMYYPNAIENYVLMINKNNNLQYISSKVRLISKAGEHLQTVGAAWSWPNFKKNMNIAHVGSLHNRSMFNEKGLFNQNFKIAGDYEFLLRFNSALRAMYLNNVTVEMMDGGISNKNSKVFFESARAKNAHTKRGISVIYFEAVHSFIKWKIKSLFK
jgi:glycosyltransferase involved in cell wall biosynthesis